MKNLFRNLALSLANSLVDLSDYFFDRRWFKASRAVQPVLNALYVFYR